jgi:hypothetical protein
MGGRYGFEDFILRFALLGLYISGNQNKKDCFSHLQVSSLD